jgi:hypothetical protein
MHELKRFLHEHILPPLGILWSAPTHCSDYKATALLLMPQPPLRETPRYHWLAVLQARI